LVTFFQAVFNGIILGAMYAMVAIGFSVIFTTTKTFHFAHGGIYVAVMFTIAHFAHSTVSLWLLAVPIGFALAIVLGAGIEVGIYKPMRRRMARHTSATYGIFVASLGLLIIFDNLIIIFFGTTAQSQPVTLYGLPVSFSLGSFYFQWAGVFQVATAAIMLGVVALIISSTQFGRSMRAVVSSVDMATLVGAKVNRIYTWAFVLGSALLVPAALLNSVTSGLDPSAGDNIILICVIAGIVGGEGSIVGAALGGLLLGLIQSMSLLVVPSQWGSSAAYIVLIGFILFRPQGLFGQKLWEAGV
jgi:branched-chain amino acid transport system permease protein